MAQPEVQYVQAPMPQQTIIYAQPQPQTQYVVQQQQPMQAVVVQVYALISFL
jgi:hypothetical protein